MAHEDTEDGSEDASKVKDVGAWLSWLARGVVRHAYEEKARHTWRGLGSVVLLVRPCCW